MQNIKLKKRQIDLATLNMFQAPTKLFFWASHNTTPKKMAAHRIHTTFPSYHC